MERPVDLVVFLGTSWSVLESHGTRWRAVSLAWAKHPRVASLTVVDFPRFGARSMLGAARPVRFEASWHPDVKLVAAAVPLPARSTKFDALGWRRVGHALRDALDLGDRSVAIAASPLWCPVLRHLGSGRTGFDAVDDMRVHPALAGVRAHVDNGYRAARGVDFVSAVSPELADRLDKDFGIRATVVPNGVDVARYTSGASDLPEAITAALPDAPFAVYVGRVNAKIDFGALEAAAKRMPVVVAGPTNAEFAEALGALPVVALGPVDVDHVPALLRRAAVGLVPFKVNELTRSMDSMKTLEYLAAGLPVVATPLPALVGLSPKVRTVADPDAFAAAACEAAAAPRHHEPDPLVLDRSWPAVADRLLALAVGGPRD